MENASKALLMAGAVLIAIMIISLGVFMFNKMKDPVEKNANMDKQEIAEFNSEIIPFTGEAVSGSQVNALINRVIAINNAALKNETTKIKITFDNVNVNGTKTSGYIDVEGAAITYNGSIKRVETGAGKFYKVDIVSYNDVGHISEVAVTGK